MQLAVSVLLAGCLAAATGDLNDSVGDAAPLKNDKVAAPAKPKAAPAPAKKKEGPARSIFLRFETDKEDDGVKVKFDGAQVESFSPGKLIAPVELPNNQSVRFDGKSMAKTNIPSNTPDLQEGFTWEGYFLTPSDNEYSNDKAIADRFLTQFVDEKGNSTRLTVGLSSAKPGKGQPPFLAMALTGTGSWHKGSREVVPDVWHHFAVVHSGTKTDGTLSLYLDHEKVASTTLSQVNGRTMGAGGAFPFVVGARMSYNGHVDRGFQGLLDEIRITNRPLKPNEFLKAEIKEVPRNVVAKLYENVPTDFTWDFEKIRPTEEIKLEAMSFPTVPPRYSHRGFETTRWGRHALMSAQELTLPEGKAYFLVRTKVDSLFSIDGKPVVDARMPIAKHPLGELKGGYRDYFAEVPLDGKPHEFALASLFDTKPGSDIGDVVLAYAKDPNGPWFLLGSEGETPLTNLAWDAYRGRTRQYFKQVNEERRQAAVERGKRYWQARRELAVEDAKMWKVTEPPVAGNPVDAFLTSALKDQEQKPVALTNDSEFLRRLSLDLRGRIPTIAETKAFLADKDPQKRQKAIDEMIASDEWADAWVGYWQDVLAENPSILRPTLNNTGPFRQWIYDSFKNNMPMDRFATELVLMEGDAEKGGTEGFALATQNDSPMAAKAHVLMTAFMAVDLKCARCHDSPLAEFSQRDMFSLAALLNDKEVAVPASSTIVVPPGGRIPAVTSDVKANEKIVPAWTIEDVAPAEFDPELSDAPNRPRAQFAAIVTSPEQPRFSDVIVNRVWRRYMGLGLVEPVDNWVDIAEASNPELLRYLSREFVASGYDMKHLVRLIVSSDAYQRQTEFTEGANEDPEVRTFAGQTRRRMTAEQLVDSLFLAVGKGFESEPLDFNSPNGKEEFLALGTPTRAWQFASLSNERDRPSLSMPVNQSIVDMLMIFGWRETRPDPITIREQNPNPLQPLQLANGMVMNRIVRLSEESAITEMVLDAKTSEELVEQLYLTLYSRKPTRQEMAMVNEVLDEGFEARKTGKPKPNVPKREPAKVNWEDHLKAEDNARLLEAEKVVREGEPATVRLTPEYRQRVEDVLWSMINSPEFVFVP